ncbi:MAG: hypothetical protein LBH93_07825 [Chitinispirillales bacterium]|jgi:thiamine-phosphate pyrophosphorylase|nr:hypothetical protein [Chitinispirillales bacterium]
MRDQNQIYRILDANFNRLREGLRVIEEHFRFIASDEKACVDIKRMRHEVAGMENAFGAEPLLKGRDTGADCFASASRPEEMERGGAGDVLRANFKRAQEACRVIEEYAKACGEAGAKASREAKAMRFLLYDLQKGRA